MDSYGSLDLSGSRKRKAPGGQPSGLLTPHDSRHGRSQSPAISISSSSNVSASDADGKEAETLVYNGVLERRGGYIVAKRVCHLYLCK